MNTTVLEQEKLLEQLAGLIRQWHAKGWSPATSTNYSLRVHADAPICFTRSGLDKSLLTAQDFMQVDPEGTPLPDYAECKPSAETRLHTLVYAVAPQTQAVLHTHSPLGAVLSRHYLAEGGLWLEGWEVLKALPGISTHEARFWLPIFANSQDMVALSAQIHARWATAGPSMAFLLAGHGLYTWGHSLAAAKRHLEALEYLLHCHDRLLRLQG